MTIRLLAGTAFVATLLALGTAQAQTAPGLTDPGPAKGVTDVGPPPAEERDSAGAVVLENSKVRAQRKAIAESSARTGVGSIGRGVIRATTRAQTQAELASAGQDEAAELRKRGAGSLTEK
jgi:hypothetical protein